MSRTSKSIDGGYTLAEVIVYVALVALLLGAIIQTAFSIVAVEKRSNAFLDLNSAALTAFSRFSRDIRRASSIDAVNSALDTNPGRLILDMKNPDGTNDTTAFYLESGTVKVDENGAYAGDLTQGDIAVSSLSFTEFSNASSSAVRVEMTLAPEASTSVPAANFYGTYVLRGSYVQ